MSDEKEFRFECQRCRFCCSGGPGYVFLSESDLKRLEEGLKIERDKLIRLYARFVDYGDHYLLSLKERKNYDCVFLSEEGCRVYEFRPVQCSTYPFWKRIAENMKDYIREGESCPGIGRGRAYSKEEREAIMAKREENIPLSFPKKG